MLADNSADQATKDAALLQNRKGPVLHLSDSKVWRGGEQQVWLLLRHLAATHANILAAPTGSLPREWRMDGSEVVSLACSGFLDIRSILVVRDLIKGRGVRLVHAHTSHAHEVAILARLGLDVPVIISRRMAFPVSGGWKYRAPDRYVAVSEAAAAELRRGGVARERITVIPDAVDSAGHRAAKPNRAGIAADESLVLCVAALSEEKDHSTLLKAWRIVEDQNAHAHLAMLGDGPLRPQLQGIAASLRLRHVVWLGHRADVLDVIHGSDVVVLTSRSEGLGSALCDAQAAGRPVVATRVGGIPEAIEERVTGLLAESGAADGVAGAILSLLADPAQRARMGAAGKARARRLFDPERTSAAYAAIYADLLR